MDARPCRRLTRLVPKESAALFSSFADYFGLATLTPTLPYYLAELGVLDIELWTGAIVSSQFAAVVGACAGPRRRHARYRARTPDAAARPSHRRICHRARTPHAACAPAAHTRRLHARATRESRQLLLGLV
jgi:hypothetical protein